MKYSGRGYNNLCADFHWMLVQMFDGLLKTYESFNLKRSRELEEVKIPDVHGVW